MHLCWWYTLELVADKRYDGAYTQIKIKESIGAQLDGRKK
jgi:hypothetical protein